MRYLLDTNICIYLIKRRPEVVFARFKQHRIGEIGISSITYSELTYGVHKSAKPQQNLQALTEFTAPLDIVPYDDHAAEAYGVIRSQLEAKGRPIGPLDTLIAAHALSLGSILVTNNEKEFSRVSGLHLENWL